MKLRLLPKKWRFRLRRKGGAGSGNWGHRGRPGLVGGSGGRGGGFVAGGVGEYNENHPSTEQAWDMMSENLPVNAVTGMPQSWITVDGPAKRQIKREIVKELAERTGMPEEEVKDFIAQWAYSSNDEDMRSLAIQKDAAEELGIAMSQWQQDSYDHVVDLSKQSYRVLVEGGPNAPTYEEWMVPQTTKHGSSELALMPSDQQRTLIREMYNNTQEKLAAAGFQPDDTIRLYRGVGVPEDVAGSWVPGDVVNYNGNSMESWSVGGGVAQDFAKSSYRDVGGPSLILEMDVPVRNIVGTARSGFGCLGEGEFVVIGSLPNQQARVAARIADRPNTMYGVGEDAVWYDPNDASQGDIWR